MATDTVEKVETEAMPRKKRKARWNIETTLRDVVLTQMLMVVADKKSSHAAVCKASALLLRAEAQNQKDEQRKKKKVVKKNIPVVHLDWNCAGARVGGQPSASSTSSPQASSGQEESEVGDQIAREDNSKGQDPVSVTPPRKKRARRWNIKPEYRDVMVRRWSMIVADPKASQTMKFAVAALMMRAEAQNQKDEEYRRKTKKNRPPKQIVVGWTGDFYNNNAHELAAERAAAEASAGSSVAEMKEDRDLRPEVKQDAAGADRVSACGRFATGPPE